MVKQNFNANDFTAASKQFKVREASQQEAWVWLILTHPTPHFKMFVEVGVYNGNTPRKLLEYFSDLYYVGVDHWLPFEEAVFDRTIFQARDSAYKIIEPYPTRARIWEGNSHLVAQHFPQGTMDYIFIDGAHSYDPCMRDLEAWWPKLRTGGVMGLHDYGFQEGVRGAATKFFGPDAGDYIGGSADLFWIVK